MEKIAHTDRIVEFRNFFSDEECDATIEFFKQNIDLWEETCFFNARVISPDQAAESGISDLFDTDHFWEVRSRFEKAAEEVFGKKLRNLGISGHVWQEGAFAAMHSDNHDMDGNPQPGWIENKLVTIVYLNDDYVGGHLVFKNFPVDIKPKKGTLVVFDVDYAHTHGVTEITSGTRFTMMSSFDYADSVYGEDHYKAKHDELAQTAEFHREQRRLWNETGQADQEALR